MLSRYDCTRGYLLAALENGPHLLGVHLRDLTNAEADYRPDPERFSIREVVAHLADWESICLSRLRRMRDEDNPSIESIDEGGRAAAQFYSATDPSAQARLFAKRRDETVGFLRTLSTADWERTASRAGLGLRTVEDQAVLMALHDNYHLRQVADWRWTFSGRGW
jgi:hypothetical protein